MKYSGRFRDLLDNREKELNIKYLLGKEEALEVLVSVDLYKEADRQFLYRILNDLKDEKIDYVTALHFIERRRETYWYKSDGFSSLTYHYRTIYYFLRFMEKMKRIDMSFQDVSEGWNYYTKDLYKLDTLYRKFHHAYQESGSPGNSNIILNGWRRSIPKDFSFPFPLPGRKLWIMIPILNL